MEQLRLDTPLARFIKDRKHYSPVNKSVKPRAFMPPSDLKLSVFQIQDLADLQIWQLGDEHVSDSVRARGDFTVSIVTQLGLNADPDDVPERHVNIIGWPEEKHEQKSIAQELAAKATLVLP